MIHILIGIQGSGKTTFAKSFAPTINACIVSTDSVRKSHPGIDETLVWKLVYEQVAINVKNNIEVIFDATSITPKVRKRFIDEVSKFGITPEVCAYFFETDKNECYKRVVERNKIEGELPLPPEVVYSYSERLIPPTFEEGFAKILIVKDSKIVEELVKDNQNN